MGVTNSRRLHSQLLLKNMPATKIPLIQKILNVPESELKSVTKLKQIGRLYNLNVNQPVNSLIDELINSGHENELYIIPPHSSVTWYLHIMNTITEHNLGPPSVNGVSTSPTATTGCCYCSCY